VTVSTGIGGGIIIDGKLFTGHTGMAGEFGHMVIEPDGIPCACGSRGCWERYASGSAIAARAKEGIHNGKNTVLVEIAGGYMEKIDARLIRKAAVSGDIFSQGLIYESAKYLAMGFGNLINIFNPEIIIVGGGCARMGKILLRPAFELTKNYSFKETYEANRFRLAKLGGKSGIMGTAAHVFGELLINPKST
jgi:glucokinase